MKIRLHQTFGAHAGRTRELDQDVITFGRLPTSDVAFDPHADLDASGSHAEIRREAGVWILRDAGSRNGTLVAGRPVQRHELADGDEIEFGTGGPRVRVEILAGAPKPLGTMAATPILSPVPSASPHVGFGAPGTLAPSTPKMYGQQTLDAAVEAAAAKARAEAMSNLETQRAPKGTALLPQSHLPQGMGAPAAAPIAQQPQVAPVAPSSDGTLWMIGSIVALFVFLAMCLLSCIVVGYLYRFS